MTKPKILVVWSNYHKDLAKKQLDDCVNLLEKAGYDYTVETVEAGTQEIPSVIRYYTKYNPYDAYITLSLLLKGKTDHYEFIWEQVKDCFVQFAMEGVLIGFGIISALDKETLQSRVESGERVKEAFNAVDYLLRFSKRVKEPNL